MRRTHKSAEFGWVAPRIPIPPSTFYAMSLSFIVSVIRHVSTLKCNGRLSKVLHFCSLVSFIYRRGRFSGQLRQGHRHSFITNLSASYLKLSAAIHITVTLSFLFLLLYSMAPTGSAEHAAALVFRSMRSERGETFPSASSHELTISP